MATKAELKIERHKIADFIGQSYFVNDGTQNYLIFQPLYYTLKRLADTEKLVSRKSSGLSTEQIVTPPPYSLTIKWYGNSNFWFDI